MSLESTVRFSDRVEDYVRYRPGYPLDVVEVLISRGALRDGQTIADIGSGTGKSCEPFLSAGFQVIGVEPNREMREAGDALLRRFPGFRSVDGRAEATGLADASVDAVIAGQAFHWFDTAAARRELARIVRPPGLIALIWNDRETTTSPFLCEYESLLKTYCPEYTRVSSKWADEPRIRSFFAPAEIERAQFPNDQDVDFEGLRGRLMSSSYAPKDGPLHEPMLAELRRIFEVHARSGLVRISYLTNVYFGFVHRS